MDRISEYQKMSNEELVDLLLNRYHKKLNYDILTITPLFERVVNVHGNRHNTLAAAKNLFDKVVAHLQFHVTKEEQILFSAFVSYQKLMVLLREIVEDTFEHMQIENEILFPRFEVEG